MRHQHPEEQPVGDATLQLPEIISALSFALDLTEGADPGHAIRSTLLGMRIGIAMGLPQSLLSPLFYALQLKDVGCSSNAARVAQLFGGDDRQAKAVTKLTDWTALLHAATGHTGDRSRWRELADGLRAASGNVRRLWSVVLPGQTLLSKLRRFADLGKTTETNTHELINLRCDRGASILRKLRMNDLSCESVRHLDEHWDGSGYPEGLAGEAIPVLARISAVAQNLDVFASAKGTEQSIRILGRRSGSWFDPEVVKVAVALHKGGLLWDACEPGCPVERTRRSVVALSPESSADLRADQVDAICEAFADVVDAKSPFTFRHSVGVTETVVALAKELQFPASGQKLLQRAALLHDLGKLGVSNSILDKPGKLTPEEHKAVLSHPGMSRTILDRITGFGELARIAGEHHERLDGSGYPLGLESSQLCLESRVLALADFFTALIEDRPYRGPLSLDKALDILRQHVPHQLDSVVFEALEVVVDRWRSDLPDVFKYRAPAIDSQMPPAGAILGTDALRA